MDYNHFEENRQEFSTFEQPRVPTIVTAIKDPLFLTMCILISVSVALSFSVIPLLVMIAMWIAYSKARSGQSLESPAKLCTGALKASYIINWVGMGIILVCGVILCILAIVMPSGIDMSTELGDSAHEIIKLLRMYGEFDVAVEDIANSDFLKVFFGIFGISFLIAGIMISIINKFYHIPLYKMGVSLRESLSRDVEIVYAKRISTWIIVIAVFNAISAFGDLSDFKAIMPTGVMVALYIITHIWLKKYFSTK